MPQPFSCSGGAQCPCTLAASSLKCPPSLFVFLNQDFLGSPGPFFSPSIGTAQRCKNINAPEQHSTPGGMGAGWVSALASYPLGEQLYIVLRRSSSGPPQRPAPPLSPHSPTPASCDHLPPKSRVPKPLPQALLLGNIIKAGKPEIPFHSFFSLIPTFHLPAVPNRLRQMPLRQPSPWGRQTSWRVPTIFQPSPGSEKF